MSQFFDELARTLAQPMPRRRAMRLLGGAFVGIAFPAGVARAAGATHDCPAQNAFLCQCPSINGLFYKLCCPNKTARGEVRVPLQGAAERLRAVLQKLRPAQRPRCGDLCCKEGEFCCNRTFSLKAPHCCDYEEANKDACKDAEVTTIILAIALGGAAALTGGIAAVAIAGLAAGVGLGGVGAKICGDDPPDPKYKQLFRPYIPRLAPVRAGDGITAASATALNRVIENRVRAGAYSIAWIRSIEKAQGADKGGDKTWARRHRTAAAGYARAAATALEHDRALSTTAQRALQAAGFVDSGTTLAQTKRVPAKVKVAGLPTELARALEASDVGASRISAYRTAITRLDPKLVEGVGIFGNITDPRLSEATTKLIKTLRLSARTLAKG